MVEINSGVEAKKDDEKTLAFVDYVAERKVLRGC